MDNSFSKNQVNFYTATVADETQRLDNLLSKLLKGVPKSHIYRIIRDGEVRINKKRAEAKTKVEVGNIIRIPPIRLEKSSKENIYIPEGKFPILFEDDYFLIINKPDGVACHGGSGISFGVIEQLRIDPQYNKFLELAHRLDRDTSGILILAKKRQALVELQKLMQSNAVKKRYLALTIGTWGKNQENVKAPLLLYVAANNERRVKVDYDTGQYSQTLFNVKERYKDNLGHEFTLVEATLKTGRTHQIRVHSQHLGHSIAGDQKYGDFTLNKELVKHGLKRMFLHAYQIEFTHPLTEKRVSITCDLPLNLQNFINKICKM